MKAREWTSEMVEAFAPSVHMSPFGKTVPDIVLAGSFLYEFQRGNSRALIAARPMGQRLDIVGLVSTGDRLPASAFDAEMVEIAKAHRAHTMALCTQLPHVVRACSRAGWNVTGAVMLKEILQ